MAILEARGLVKRFGPVTAVDHVSFEVGEGQVIGLLGPNGAGKTTTLHMLLGLVTPDGGSVRLFGEDLAHNRLRALSQVNFAAGYVHLPGALTVEESLIVFARMYAVRRPRQRVRQLLLRLARETGRAMLITSHNMREVERMCDLIHFMAAGRIVATGSAAELASTYGVDDLEAVFLRVARG